MKVDKGIVGGVIGFLLAVAMMTIGFFKVVFIIICVVAGYFIGNLTISRNGYIKNLLEKILPPGLRK